MLVLERSLPPGYSPPFSVVTDQNHAAWIIIATALGLACVLVFVAARVVVRYSVTSSLGQDDWLLASSLVLSIVQFSVIVSGCSIGLGETMLHMPSSRQVRIQKTTYVSDLLWILSLGLSKISVASMIRRIDAHGRRSNVFNVITACLSVWMIASFFALAFQCEVSEPWITLNMHCTDAFLRWKIICAFDIVTELLLLGSAVYLISGVQIELARKITIIAGFACRVPIIIPIVFRIATYDKIGVSDDPSLRQAVFIVWTQTELNYSIICATIPSLLQFMRNLNTTFGGLKEQRTTTYVSCERTPSSFPMSVLRSTTETKISQRSHEAEDLEEITGFRDQAAPVASCSDLDKKNRTGSNDSESMVIRKVVAYDVHYE